MHPRTLQAFEEERFLGATPAINFMRGVPLESTGMRKVVDYGFTPVGQVAQDVKNLGKRTASKVHARISRALNRNPNSFVDAGGTPRAYSTSGPPQQPKFTPRSEY